MILVCHNICPYFQFQIFLLNSIYTELKDAFSDIIKFHLRCTDSEDRIFNHVISDISVVVRETTLTVSDSIETGSPADSEIV